jgi:hypothetical protein
MNGSTAMAGSAGDFALAVPIVEEALDLLEAG